MRNRLSQVAATISLVLTGVLVVRIVAIGKPGVVVLLVPALLGALLALRKSGRAALAVSALLTAASATVLLIGGIGLLYLPPVVMFVWASFLPVRRPHSVSRHRIDLPRGAAR
jgi:hypothetical protein